MINVYDCKDAKKVEAFKEKEVLYRSFVDKFISDMKSINICLESEPGYDSGIITYLVDYENDIYDSCPETPDVQYDYPHSIDIISEDENEE